MTPVEVCSFCRRQIDPTDRELTPAGPLHAVCAQRVDDLVASADFAAPGPRCAPGPPAGTDLDVWATAWARTLTSCPELPQDLAEMRWWFEAAFEAGADAAGDGQVAKLSSLGGTVPRRWLCGCEVDWSETLPRQRWCGRRRPWCRRQARPRTLEEIVAEREREAAA